MTQDEIRGFNWLVQDVARQRAAAFNRLMEPHGVSRAQAWIIGALSRDPGATQSELAATLGLSRVAIGNTLDRMESAGWIERQADEHDRRVWRIYLTEDIKPLRRVIARAAERVNEQSFEGFNKRERSQLIRLLLRMRDNFVAAEEEAPVKGRSAKSAAGRA